MPHDAIKLGLQTYINKVVKPNLQRQEQRQATNIQGQSLINQRRPLNPQEQALAQQFLINQSSDIGGNSVGAVVRGEGIS